MRSKFGEAPQSFKSAVREYFGQGVVSILCKLFIGPLEGILDFTFAVFAKQPFPLLHDDAISQQSPYCPMTMSEHTVLIGSRGLKDSSSHKAFQTKGE